MLHEGPTSQCRLGTATARTPVNPGEAGLAVQCPGCSSPALVLQGSACQPCCPSLAALFSRKVSAATRTGQARGNPGRMAPLGPCQTSALAQQFFVGSQDEWTHCPIRRWGK